jgi:photolyase PhrII
MPADLDPLLDRLPHHLAERCRTLAPGPLRDDGEFVLYWMHHAARGHENPALDVALEAGNALGKPVLVYQGLGGRHPYNNDRHHSFILEGARDAHRDLHALGVRAVFHLDPAGARPSPLTALARRAALLVAEDYPAPPFPAWTRELAARADTASIAVDCCCIVPMQSQTKRFDRAFAYRRHNQAEFAPRLASDWPAVRPTVAPFAGDLGFAALDLVADDVAALCAACDIDHAVPPVAGTPGGSDAGYARWEAFVDRGLAAYARERNDAAVAWPRGTSRMSPYLHHGQVSPFRIAREAWQHGGDGAAKFLDELLVWRELAFNFCCHTADPESLEALPAWARETLAAHAEDPRPVLIDDEALARSRSGDPVWDLAQTSLRVHGELHNNLRMTWAKAIPHWRPTPAAALRTLIDLNHRYALDGSDPNSYGGLLWALGLFDRPFPEAAVTGSLRGRSTRAHARRLDLERYAKRVTVPAGGVARRVAVVGAGIAGLSAAGVLQDQGHEVTVFEKSRGLGGRSATRRHGGVGFDHGAQYFTTRSDAFRRAVDAWLERGVVAPGRPRGGQVHDGGIQASPDERERFVALPGMSGIGRVLGDGLEIRTGVRVAPPRREAGRWRLAGDDGAALGDFDALVVSAPAPQAAELLAATAPEPAARAAAVGFAPCWAAMLQFQHPVVAPYDALFFDAGPVRWAARNASKPGRHGETWVVHADADWTRGHLDDDRTAVADILCRTLCDLLDAPVDGVVHRDAHRWLYALADDTPPVGALWDPERSLAVCGDWCNGSRIEGAWLSGQAAAGRLLGALADAARPALGGSEWRDAARTMQKA